MFGKCIYCGKTLFKLLHKDDICETCNTYESKIVLCKDIIKSTWLSTGSPASKYNYYIKTLHNNKEKGARIIEILKDYETPEAWYCKAIAYQLQGARFRQEQIKYARQLLESTYHLNENEITYICNLLADAYEGEYMFDEAIKIHKQLLSKHKDYTPAHIKIARLMVKQNKIDDAIKMLKEIHKQLKSKPVYYNDPFTGKRKLDPIYKSDLLLLSSHIKELKEKKERGYVYRPRKRRKQSDAR